MKNLLNKAENAYANLDKAYEDLYGILKVLSESIYTKLKEIGMLNLDFFEFDQIFNLLEDLFKPIFFACLNDKIVPVLLETKDFKGEGRVEEKIFVKRFPFTADLVYSEDEKQGYPCLGFYDGYFNIDCSRLVVDPKKGSIEGLEKNWQGELLGREFLIDCSQSLQKGKIDKESFKDFAAYINKMDELQRIKSDFKKKYGIIHSSDHYAFLLVNDLHLQAWEDLSVVHYRLGSLRFKVVKHNAGKDSENSQNKERIEDFSFNLLDYKKSIPELITDLKQIDFDRFWKIVDEYKSITEKARAVYHKYLKYKRIFEGAKILISNN